MESYSEKVMEHFRDPHNVGEIPDASGIGKVGNPVCVVGGTIVLCNSSRKSVEDITEGTRVLGHDGRFHKVKTVFKRQYKGNLYKIFIKKIGCITITPEHHILAVRYYKSKNKNKSFPDWYMASELRRGDKILFPIPKEKGCVTYPYTLKKWNDYYSAVVDRIEQLEYDGEVYNLEVEDARSYVTGCATLHNCGDIMNLYIKVENDIIVDAKFKTFGCLPKEMEVVLSGGGWAPIAGLREGDSVVNAEGDSAKVLEVFARDYEGSIIEIVPFVSPYNFFSVTPEHPILCVKRSSLNKVRKASFRCDWLRVVDKKELEEKKPDYIYARDIEKGDYLVFTVTRDIKDNPKFTKDMMRLMGYYLAEGYVVSSGNTIAFALNKNENKVAEDLKSLILKVLDKNPRERIRKNVREIYVCSKKSADFFKQFLGSLAKHKALSKEIMILPFDKQKELIKTYLIGDGNFYRRRQQDSFTYRVSTVSPLLAIQIQEILARGGIFAALKKIYKSSHVIEGRRIKPSYAYLISFKLERKHNFVHKCNNYFLIPVRELKRKPFKGYIYNISVNSGSNSYLVKGFAVHNCGAAIATSSMVTDLVKGKTVEDALKISNRAVAEALGGLPPIKMHCSLLAEQALRSAIDDYLKKSGKKK